MFNWYNTQLNLNCNVRENRKNFRTDVQYLCLLECKSLKIRTKMKDFNIVENVCQYQITQFVTEFSNYYRRREDPILNQSLEILECSSLRVLQSDRTLSIGKRIIKDATTKF